MEDALRERMLGHIDERLGSTLDTAREKREVDANELADDLPNDTVIPTFRLDDPEIIYAKQASGVTSSLHKIIGHLFEDWVEELIEARFDISDDQLVYSEVVDDGGEAPRAPDPVILFELLDGDEAERLTRVANNVDTSLRQVRPDQDGWRGIGIELKGGLQSNDRTRKTGISDTGDHLQGNDILPIFRTPQSQLHHFSVLRFCKLIV